MAEWRFGIDINRARFTGLAHQKNKSSSNCITILGVDPGTRVVGFALLRSKKPNPLLPKDFSVIDAGVIKADVKLSHTKRIGMLHQALYEIATSAKPDVCVIEKAFYGLNASSSLKLGEARGALISAVARCDTPVAEITPAEVKKIIAGNGRAEKQQVADAVQSILKFDAGGLPHDVTDALAIALTYGLELSTKTALKKANAVKGATV